MDRGRDRRLFTRAAAAHAAVALVLSIVGLSILPSPAMAQVDVSSARSESAALTEQAQAMVSERRLGEAARLFERAVTLDDANLAAHVGLSGVLFQLEEHDRALRLLRQTETRLGWNKQLGTQLGMHLAATKQLAEAKAELWRVLRADERAYEAAFHLGTVCTSGKDWSCAVWALRRYLKARPGSLKSNDAHVRTRIAYGELQRGRAAQAERELMMLLEQRRDDPAARLLLATVYVDTKRCKQGLPLLEKLRSYSQRVPEVEYNRALCFAREGRLAPAFAALASYEKARPGEGRARILRARLFRRQRRYDSAIAEYKAAIDSGVAAQGELAGLYHERGRHEDAVATVWPLVEEKRATAPALRIAAESLIVLRDTERSRVACASLLSLRPRDPASHELSGRTELLGGDHVKAAAAFEQALALDKNRVRSRHGLAIALEHHATAAMKAERFDDAQRHLQRALEINPTSPSAAQNLAALELRQGRPARARALLEPHRALAAKQPTLGAALASAYEATGEVGGARELWERIGRDAKTAPELRARALAAAAVLDPSNLSTTARKLEEARRLVPSSGHQPLARYIDELRAATELKLGERELGRRRGAAARVHLTAASRTKLPELAARARFGLAIAEAQSRTYARATKILDSISTEAISGLLSPIVDRGARDFARLYLAYLSANAKSYRRMRGLVRAADRVVARTGQDAAPELRTAWLEKMLYGALVSRRRTTADLVVDDARGQDVSAPFRHNAAVRRGTTQLTVAEKQELQAVAADVPEARVNLALSADAEGNDAKAVELLRRIDAKTLSVHGLRPWLEWKELLQ
jgi:Flp pilus assembly protein TadD